MSAVERTNKQAAYEASRHAEQQQRSTQAERTRVIPDRSNAQQQTQQIAQQQAQQQAQTRQDSRTALIGALGGLIGSLGQSRPAEPQSSTVERYNTVQETAEELHDKVQKRQDAIVSKIQDEQWKKIKEEHTRTLGQVDELTRSIDSVRANDGSQSAVASSSRSSSGGGGNPWADSPRSAPEVRNSTTQATTGSGIPSQQNPWADSQSVAIGGDAALLSKPLAAGMVLFREAAGGTLRIIGRNEVGSTRGDTERNCSADGVGLVIARCELQRKRKSTG